MKRTFVFYHSAVIDDPLGDADLSDEARDANEAAVMEAARTQLAARYPTVRALVDDAVMDEDIEF